MTRTVDRLSPLSDELVAVLRKTTTDALDGVKSHDAIVVGAGAAGGLAALLLAEAGLRVLVLDAGWRPSFWRAPVRRSIGEMVKRVSNPRLLEILPPAAIRLGSESVRFAGRYRQPVQSQCYAWPLLPEAFADDIDTPYSTNPEHPFFWIRARALGGRMIVPEHGCQYYRLGDKDFSGLEGVRPAWPFTSAEINPWYELVEQRLGLSGRVDGASSIPDSMIRNELQLTSSEVAFKEAVKTRWPEAEPVLGRYAPPLDSLGAAAATGRLMCRQGAVVSEVETDGSGRIAGVVWHDIRHGATLRARAPLVFLCASTLESTRILMTSRGAGGSGSLDAAGVLGHYLMDHVQISAEGTGPALSEDDRDKDWRRCIYLPNFRPTAATGSDKTTNFGVQLYQRKGTPGTSSFFAIAFAEMSPRAENFVSLDPSRRDSFGNQTLRINCAHNENETRVATMMSGALRNLAEVAGASLGRVDDEPAPPGTAVHECGTARMGTDPASSVLDPFNQCWQAPGLYVTDGSAFPSQGSQNPTLTIMALTARACAHATGAKAPMLAVAAGT